VSVDVGNVKVPVLLIEDITGVVKVLFVKVSAPVKVTNPAVLTAAACQAEPE